MWEFLNEFCAIERGTGKEMGRDRADKYGGREGSSHLYSGEGEGKGKEKGPIPDL